MNYRGACVHFLSLIRFCFAPFVISYLILYYTFSSTPWALITLGLHIICASTDFWDGYYARLWKVQSIEGGILDLMADKAYFFSLSFALVTMHKLSFWCVLLFVIREYGVLGLRLWVLSTGIKSLPPVLYSAKMKTLWQSIAIACAISRGIGVWQSYMMVGEYISCSIALACAYYSAYWYARYCLKKVYGS